MTVKADKHSDMKVMLRALRLPSFSEYHEELAIKAERNGWSFGQYLKQLSEMELIDRQKRKIERLKKQSHLDSSKTLELLEQKCLPIVVKRQLPTLCDGNFLKQAKNILSFGLPGRGKTHVISAIGHELIRKGFRIIFFPAFKLVEKLLNAKKELILERELRKLDRYDAVIIDDIGYIQQSREEMEVLFHFLAERYERRSVMITSNLVFSQWDKIFKDAMTTAAAIDRLVHHSVILEMTGDTYRGSQAKANKGRI